jgi:hypothetical protein
VVALVSKHQTLGGAKKAARDGTKRDEAEWKVYFIDSYSSYPYEARPACEPVPYPSITKFIWSTKEDEKKRRDKILLDIEVSRKKRELAKVNTITLTSDEKELLEFILRPEDRDRDFWPGTDKTKDSLWDKIRKAMA